MKITQNPRAGRDGGNTGRQELPRLPEAPIRENKAPIARPLQLSCLRQDDFKGRIDEGTCQEQSPDTPSPLPTPGQGQQDRAEKVLAKVTGGHHPSCCHTPACLNAQAGLHLTPGGGVQRPSEQLQSLDP